MAEEEAARAFLDLQVDGRVSGAAAVSWVAGHPRFAALSRPARAKAWSVADSNDSGTLDDAQFEIFVKELDDAATASDASTPVAAAAAAGLVVGGPPGAVVLGGLTACYQSLSRVASSQNPSSNTHSIRFLVKGPRAGPKRTVREMCPSAHGHIN